MSITEAGPLFPAHSKQQQLQSSSVLSQEELQIFWSTANMDLRKKNGMSLDLQLAATWAMDVGAKMYQWFNDLHFFLLDT